MFRLRIPSVLGFSWLFATATLTPSAHASTTPGTLTLSTTFEAISVRATFSGDPNGNNAATLKFRKQGDANWLDAFAPIVDRRADIDGVSNPNANQARGSIVGLTPGTTYEVSLTFVDPDGVSGSALTGTVTTLASAPPLGGKTLYVDDVASTGDGSQAKPFNSIPAALNAAAPGDTIRVAPGTYPPFTISKSGTATGYIAIVGETRDQVFIDGGPSDNIQISGSYIQLKDLRLKQSSHNSIVTSGNHHVWLENIYHEDISGSLTYDDAGVQVANASDVYILNSEFHSPTLTAAPPVDPPWDGPGEAIYVGGGVSSLVIKGNLIEGGFRDCIGNSPESWGGGALDNSDIAYNTVTGCRDDAIQIEGENVNLRIYGNDVTANNGYSALAMQPHIVGPTYVFRNVLREEWDGAAGYAFKLGGSGFTFYIHNTVDTSGTSQKHDSFAGVGPNEGLFGNIIKSGANPLYGVSGSSKYDANLYHPAPGYPVVSAWDGTGTNYDTLADFQNATGQEKNGREGDPVFIDSAKHIDATSPAVDAGIVIPNFNDAASAWPFCGAAPDIGAYETGNCAPVDAGIGGSTGAGGTTGSGGGAGATANGGVDGGLTGGGGSGAKKSTSDDSGGCGCRVASAPSHQALWLLGFVIAAARARRRKARARAMPLEPVLGRRRRG